MSWPLLTFSSVAEKTGRCWEDILGSWGHALVAVAVEKRFIKTRVNVWTARRNKKTGRCREVAVSRGSTVFCLLHLLLLKLSRCHRRRRRTRDLTKPRRRRQRERQKTMGLISKTTTLHVHHAFLYTSLPSLHDYDVKWPHFKFTWERERQADKFYHLCPNLSAFPPLQLQPKSPSFK